MKILIINYYNKLSIKPPVGDFSEEKLKLLIVVTNAYYKLLKQNLNLPHKNNIKSWFFTIWENNYCIVLTPPEKYLNIFSEFFRKIKTNIVIKIPLKKHNLIRKLGNLGFEYPYICSRGENLYLTKKYGGGRPQSPKKLLIIPPVGEYCKSVFKIHPPTLKFLKNLCLGNVEKSGILNIREGGPKNLYIVDVDHGSIVRGSIDGVNVVAGFYNFHSHPITAYQKHKAILGWPSVEDYSGFLFCTKKYNTIFHIVVSLEGIYILSLSREWCSKKNKPKNIDKFIENNYNYFPHDINENPKKYVNIINNIKFYNTQIFVIQYFSWKNAHKAFNIEYHKNEQNCFTCPKIQNFYKKINFKFI